MAHGHADARRYPLGMLADETSIVIERVNGATVTEASLLQNAVHGILSKKARDAFDKAIRSLNVETRVINLETGDEEAPSGLPRLLPQGY